MLEMKFPTPQDQKTENTRKVKIRLYMRSNLYETADLTAEVPADITDNELEKMIYGCEICDAMPDEMLNAIEWESREGGCYPESCVSVSSTDETGIDLVFNFPNSKKE